MTVEELLKPRIKIIALWPHEPERNLGMIIKEPDVPRTPQWEAAWNDWNELLKHPHLLKPLEWWEERDEKDMPEYVKMKRVEGVFRVKKYVKGKFLYARLFDYAASVKVTTLTPATKEEYEQQLQTTNK